jgi:superfamily I DNA/RNA helicase
VNYRCPATVVDRAVRLIGHNRARFTKTIRARPEAPGPIVLAADDADEPIRMARVLRAWPDDDRTRAILARTNRELLPAVAVALELGMPFRPPPIELLVTSPHVDACLTAVESVDPRLPLPARIEAVRSRWAALQDGDLAGEDAVPGESLGGADATPPAEIARAVLAWSLPHRSLEELREAIQTRRSKLLRLCLEDAPLTFATAHATKGLEFDHVAVIGLDEGRFPSARSVADAPEPDRALEEERRLAYVAWTRARRSLTLVYDPAHPSPFLLEAFGRAELGLRSDPTAA